MMFKVIFDKGSFFDVQLILHNLNVINQNLFPNQETLIIPSMGDITKTTHEDQILEMPAFFTLSVLVPDEGDEFDKNEKKQKEITEALIKLFQNPKIEILDEIIKMNMVSEILKDMRQ